MLCVSIVHLTVRFLAHFLLIGSWICIMFYHVNDIYILVFLL